MRLSCVEIKNYLLTFLHSQLHTTESRLQRFMLWTNYRRHRGCKDGRVQVVINEKYFATQFLPGHVRFSKVGIGFGPVQSVRWLHEAMIVQAIDNYGGRDF